MPPSTVFIVLDSKALAPGQWRRRSGQAGRVKGNGQAERVKGNGNLQKTKKSLPICLLLFCNNVDSNTNRNCRKPI